MEYDYRSVNIYADPKDNLLFVPTAESEKWGGLTVEIDLITELKYPYTDSELERALVKALEQCHTKAPNDDLKVTAIETYFKVKGYNKAVKDKRLVTFNWRKSTGYSITPTCKEPKNGYTDLKDSVFILGHELTPRELVMATREAMKLSTC